MDRYDVVIAGGGHAGAHAATSLRQRKWSGRVAIVSAEREPPYERPPLSKEYLAGERAFERMLLRPAAFWEASATPVTLVLGRRVAAVDPGPRVVTLDDGATLAYGALVWAAGGRARRLGCEGDLAGVHTLRERADADRLRAELPAAERVVIVGGGYVGLEAAAVLRGLGKSVVVLEAQGRLLARVTGGEIARFFEAEHRARDVDVRLGAKVARLEGDVRVRAVVLDDGARLPADLVLVAVGLDPVVGPLAEAGARCEDGVDVDDRCRTSLPDVYAVGDCARQQSAFADAPVRIESVQNAYDQAAIAAAVITGATRDAPRRGAPTFWSNQYDLRLQSVGLVAGHDDVVVRGDPSSRAFAVVYLRGGRVVALDAVNRGLDAVHARALVEARAAAPREALADPSVPLRSLVASA